MYWVEVGKKVNKQVACGNDAYNKLSSEREDRDFNSQTCCLSILSFTGGQNNTFLENLFGVSQGREPSVKSVAISNQKLLK